jgi:predicted Zn-dependent protease
MERALFTAGNVLSGIDPAAAIPMLEKVVQIDPRWGAPHQILGNTLLKLDELEGAAHALRRAIELDPKDVHAFNSLGVVLARQDCLEEARTACLAALSLRPMFETWANLALLDVRRGDAGAAELELRIALDLAPQHSVLRIVLADELGARGAVESALSELETVVGVDPQNGMAWERLAQRKAELGDAEGAALAAEIGRELALPR